MKKFIKNNTIITIERNGMVRTYELRDSNYPPVQTKYTCLYSKAIKSLIIELKDKGYTQVC